MNREDKVATLIQHLKHPNRDLRKEAAEALGKFGDARAVEPLIQALKDDYARVRIGAARSLGELSDARAVEPLIRALKEGRYTGPAKTAMEALVKLGDADVRPLIQALEDKDVSVRIGAAKALGELGDASAVKLLVQALEDEDWKVRQAVAKALDQADDARAVEPLVQALEDEDWKVRAAAAEALGELGDPRAVEPLIKTLKDDTSGSEAARALGKLGDARAVEVLIQALGDRRCGLQTAPKALSQLGEAGVKALVEALNRKDWEVSLEVAKALGDVGHPKGIEHLSQVALSSDWKLEAYRATERLIAIGGEKVLGILIQILNTKRTVKVSREENGQWFFVGKASNTVQRVLAAEALGQFDDPKAIEALSRALKDSERDVQRAAAQTLGERELIEPLVEALNDYNMRTRRGKEKTERYGGIALSVPKWYSDRLLPLTEALGKFGDARAIIPLIRTLWLVYGIKVCNSAQKALESILSQIGHEEAVEFLIQALDAESDFVRRRVVTLLGGFDDERAVNCLIQVYRHDASKQVREAAAKALGDRRPRSWWEKWIGR